MSTENFVIPSQDELNSQSQSSEFLPVEAEDYIIKLAKIELRDAPTFVGNKPQHDKTEKKFRVVCLPFALKAGGVMRDVQGQEVKPLTRWIWKDLSFKTNFMPDHTTPTFLRALIAYLEGKNVNDSIAAPTFILLDKNKNEVTDKNIRAIFIGDTNGRAKLQAQGFEAVPDIRPYEGRYVACAIEVDAKGRNKITKFSKLPESFYPPTPDAEKEMMEKFEVSYAKFKAKEAGRTVSGSSSSSSVQPSSVMNEQLEIDQIPF